MNQTLRIPYGAHADQWADLYVPAPAALPADGAWRGLVVVVHGGYWRDKYTAELGAPLAQDLAEHGFAAWNLEYRRAGSDLEDGTRSEGAGGWPRTFEDIAAGIDHLADVPGSGLLADDDDAARLARALEAGRVVALGHSAGGHLAVWAAGRRRWGDVPRVPLAGVVSQAGVLDLHGAERLGLSSHAVRNLMGSPSDTSAGIARCYAVSDPMRALPIGVPVHAVHSRDDEAVPFSMSELYVAAAQAKGDPAVLHETSGDHFAVITPGHEAYALCRKLVGELLG